jgi:hypothetical protein
VQADDTILTTDGSEIAVGGGVLSVTFPSGWAYVDSAEDEAVYFENADGTVYGFIAHYIASENGITPETDLVALLTELAEGSGEVTSPAASVALGEDYLGATTQVSMEGETGLMFLVFNPAADRLAFAEFLGEPSEIEGNQDLYEILYSIRLNP